MIVMRRRLDDQEVEEWRKENDAEGAKGDDATIKRVGEPKEATTEEIIEALGKATTREEWKRISEQQPSNLPWAEEKGGKIPVTPENMARMMAEAKDHEQRIILAEIYVPVADEGEKARKLLTNRPVKVEGVASKSKPEKEEEWEEEEQRREDRKKREERASDNAAVHGRRRRSEEEEHRRREGSMNRESERSQRRSRSYSRTSNNDQREHRSREQHHRRHHRQEREQNRSHGRSEWDRRRNRSRSVTPEEPRDRGQNRQLCGYFNSSNGCRRGQACQYSHGQQARWSTGSR
jgi:hypothetical protein